VLYVKFLFDTADKYLKQFDWKDLALVKFCLFAMGIICGMQIKDKYKKPATIGALMIFLATYIPLMADFLPMLKNEFHKVKFNQETSIEIQ